MNRKYEFPHIFSPWKKNHPKHSEAVRSSPCTPFPPPSAANEVIDISLEAPEAPAVVFFHLKAEDRPVESDIVGIYPPKCVDKIRRC